LTYTTASASQSMSHAPKKLSLKFAFESDSPARFSRAAASHEGPWCPGLDQDLPALLWASALLDARRPGLAPEFDPLWFGN